MTPIVLMYDKEGGILSSMDDANSSSLHVPHSKSSKEESGAAKLTIQATNESQILLPITQRKSYHCELYV